MGRQNTGLKHWTEILTSSHKIVDNLIDDRDKYIDLAKPKLKYPHLDPPIR